MKTKLKDRIRRVEERAVFNLLRKLLNASTFIDSVSGLERANEMLRGLRPALEDLAAIHPEAEFKSSPESGGQTFMTPRAKAIVEDLIHRGEVIIDSEKVELKRADDKFRFEANTSSKLLKKMVDLTTNIDGLPDVETAMRRLYALRRDLEKLATIHPDLAFKHVPTDPALRNRHDDRNSGGSVCGFDFTRRHCAKS